MDKKGFSLLELVMVLAILAIIVGLSIPAFYSMKSQGDLSAHSRKFMADLRKAQTMASSGKSLKPGCSGNIRQAGISVTNATTYQLYLRDEGGCVVVDKVHTFPAGSGLTFPAVGDTRFRNDGTVITPMSKMSYQITDTGRNVSKVITITVAGFPKITG